MHFMFSSMDLHREWEMLFCFPVCSSTPREWEMQRASSTPREQENWSRSMFGNLQLLSNDASSHLQILGALSRGGKYHYGDWEQKVKWLLTQKGRGTVWDLFTPLIFSVNKTTSCNSTELAAESLATRSHLRELSAAPLPAVKNIPFALEITPLFSDQRISERRVIYFVTWCLFI